MSERCNNSACFSVEIKGTSDICVTFVVYACGKSILGVRTHEKDTMHGLYHGYVFCPAARLPLRPLFADRAELLKKHEGRELQAALSVDKVVGGQLRLNINPA